METTPNDM